MYGESFKTMNEFKPEDNPPGRYTNNYNTTKELSLSRQDKGASRNKIKDSDEYSEGDVSLIMDDEMRKTNSKAFNFKDGKGKKAAAAKEIFGEVDSVSTENKKEEKKGFRIKKDARPVHPKTAAVNKEYLNNNTNLRMNHLEGNYKKNKLISNTDKDVRIQKFGETGSNFNIMQKENTSGGAPFKEMTTNEKIVRQMQVEKELKLKYATFYNKKDFYRSKSSSNNNNLQNNFIKTGKFQKQSEEEKSESRNNSRNYDKPWLRNANGAIGSGTGISRDQKMAMTQGNWRHRQKKETKPVGRTSFSRENDFIDFDQYKKEINTMMKETNATDSKKNIESKETMENRSEEQKSNRRLLHYEVGKRLGKGSYAVVHEAMDTKGQFKCAIKTYEKAKMNSKTRKTIIEREIQVLNFVDHPKMIKLHKVIQTKNHIHIVMDLADGDVLSQFYKSQPNKRLKESEAASIFKQIIDAMGY